MLATIGIVLVVLWLLGLLVFKVTGAIIHIALVIGLVLLVLHFVRGRRSV
ncbi:lmo0937 family membrane protein [Sphingomonas sp. BN140010]|uniref:Lmo0937 family membrane protein n=1 Tax=Sphingomonas arvum TaxID=2992113 RepID=A0ABT3JJ57_9SPHN|nr:lmo0937 family membrane protein [Sphingomonas sp. BN140010]MCW3798790.1 lmo0937 family membrane protein [Sphingomonas sp. BN140010]